MELEELRTQCGEHLDAADEIQNRAVADSRELTEEESREYGEHMSEVRRLRGVIKRRMEICGEREGFNSIPNRSTEPDPPGDTGVEDRGGASADGDPPAWLTVGAPLRAFRGPNAHRDAYRAAHWLRSRFCPDEGLRARSAQYCRDHGVGLEGRGALAGVPSSGGYLTAVEFSMAYINLLETYGVFRRFARREMMAEAVKNIPRLDGHLVAYFTGEGESLTESEQTWGQVQLVARKMTVYTRMSSEMNEDSLINFADNVATDVAYAFALKEDTVGFLGDGTSTSGGRKGVVTTVTDGSHSASVATAATGNTSFGTLDDADFEAALARLPEWAHENAAWFISRQGYQDSMARLKFAGGGNTAEDLASPTRMSYRGYPVIPTQVLSKVLTAQTGQVACAFGDLRAASILGERRGTRMRMSEHVHFATDEIAIAADQRVDIVAANVGSDTEAGPIIVLKFASG